MIDGIVAAFVVAGKIRPQPPFLPWAELARAAVWLVAFGLIVFVMAWLVGG